MARLLVIHAFLYSFTMFSLAAQSQKKIYPHHLWGSWEEIATNAQAAGDLQSIVTFEKDGTYKLQIGDVTGEGKWRLIRRKQRIKVKRFHYTGPQAQNQEVPYDFELGVQMPNDSTLILKRKRDGKTYQATYRRRAAAAE